MKKNLSLLSKLGISLSAALLAGSAWALMPDAPTPTDDTVEEVWTVPTTIDTGKPVTFVAVKSATEINQMDKTFAGTPYDVKANRALSDTTDYQFAATTETVNDVDYLTFKNDANQYLVEDGTVALRDETSKVMWSYSSPNLKAKSNNRYLYFSKEDSKFSTSDNTNGAVIFQKGDVKKPTITLSDGALDYTTDKTATAPAIRVSATDNIKPTLTLSDPESQLKDSEGNKIGQNTKLIFEVQCSDDSKVILQSQADGDKVLNLVDYAGTHIKVKVFTEVYATANGVTFQISETTPVEYECDVVDLANPTLEANDTRLSEKAADDSKKITVQVDQLGKASVQAVGATEGATNTVMISEYSDMSSAENTTSVVDYKNQTVYATVKSAKNGVETAAFPYTIEVKPNLNATEVVALFGTIDPTPTAGTRQEGGTKITLKYDVETDAQGIYEISPAAPNIEVKVTVGAATTPVTVTAKRNSAEDGYEFNLPAALLTEGFSVAVPAGSFKAAGSKPTGAMHINNVETEPYINQYYSPAATFTYQNKYDGTTFEIYPVHSNIDTDDNAKSRFNITAPSNTPVLPAVLASEASTWTGDTVLTGIKVTDLLNKEVTTPYTVKYNRTDANDLGYYEVAFTGSLPVDDYMVMFPASKLIDSKMTGQSTNNNNVTAYIHVMPKVSFEYILANDPAATTQPAELCCNKDLYVIVNPTSTLGNREAELKQTDLLKASLTTNNKGSQVIELEATTKTNVYKVTTDLENTGKLFDAYKSYFRPNLVIPAGLFVADNTVCPDAKTKTTVYHHVDYTVENNSTPVIVDSKATSFSFDLKATSDKDKAQTISGTYTVKLNGKDATMTVAAPDATTGISQATITGDFSALDGDYTVTIPANTLSKDASTTPATVKYCGCEQPQLTVNIKVCTVGYTFAAVKGITTNDDTFLMKAQYTLEGVTNPATLAVAIPAAAVVDVEGVKGTITGYDSSNEQYTVKLASKLARKTGGDTYTVTVAKDMFGSGTGSMNDGTETFELGVQQYVNFAVASSDYLLETSDNPTEFDFAIATTPKDIDGDDIVVGPAVEPALFKNKLSVNVGGTIVNPTDVQYKEEDADGNSVFHVVLEKSLAVGNYVLVIDQGALSAVFNTNPKNLNVYFQVMNKVLFATDPASIETNSSAAGSASFNVTAAWANNTDRTSKLKATGAVFEVPEGSGIAVSTTTTANKFDVSYPADLADGDYTINIKKGTLKADASVNDDDIEIVLHKEVFELEDAYINQTTKSFDIKLSDEAVTVESPTSAYVAATPVTLSNSSKTGYVTVTLPAALAQSTAGYHISFAPAAIKGQYAHNTDALTAWVYVANELAFIDAVDGKTTTAASEITTYGDYETITYERDYTGKYEPLYLPFEVTLTDDILNSMTIWKFYAITLDTNNQPVFNFKTTQVGDKIYPNMPYIILADQGNATIEFKDVKVSKPAADPSNPALFSSTTSTIYNFYGVIDAATPAAKKWVLSKSTGLLGYVPDTNEAGMLKPWRWYMTTTDKGFHYAKIALDGVEIDDATAIMKVETSEDGQTIYSISGVRLSTPKKGAVNIVNGKKVFTK